MFTKSGCPASDLNVLYEIAQDKLIKYPECAIWRKKVLAEINVMPEPDLIVLAASSAYNDFLLINWYHNLFILHLNLNSGTTFLDINIIMNECTKWPDYNL